MIDYNYFFYIIKTLPKLIINNSYEYLEKSIN